MLNEFRQGNTYKLNIQLLNKNEEILDISTIKEVEFSFGKDLKKIYDGTSEGEVTYNNLKKCFIVPLEQSETFEMENQISIQARVKFKEDIVKGSLIETYDVAISLSKEEL